jgi:hypothetical protein
MSELDEPLTGMRRSGRAYAGLVDAMFFRVYSSSLRRPWLRSEGAGFNDAIYRLSVSVAAPFVLMFGLLIGCVKAAFPLLLPGRAAAYLFVVGFFLIGFFTVFVLNRRFAAYEENAESIRSASGVRTRSDWLFEAISLASIIGYVATLYWLL